MVKNFNNIKNKLKPLASEFANTFANILEQERKFAEQDRQEKEERRNQKKLQEEELKRREAEYQQQLLHAQTQHFHDTQLRKLWAYALNALPPHLRLYPKDVDVVALSNTYSGNVRWVLKVAVSDSNEYTRTRLHQLQEMLNQIFLQILMDGVKEFIDYIVEDRNQLQYELINAKLGLITNYPNVNNYLTKYQNFYNTNCWELYGISIFNIFADNSFLVFTYDVSVDELQRFSPNNYFYLLNLT